jgi:ketosteroid isomerase-like protein
VLAPDLGLAGRDGSAFHERMGDRDEFLDWFDSTWRPAERALHDGDAGPRFRTWSDVEPVTLFGAWEDAFGAPAVHEVFLRLAGAFSGSVSAEIEIIAAEASGDFAYTVHREITSTGVGGQRRDYVLRVTQVYRREGGEWKVVHRHGDDGPRPPET